jgi:hypothetical protein
MEAARSFVNNNRQLLINIAYFVVFAVILYLIYYYLTAGDELQIVLLQDIAAGNKPPDTPLPPLAGVNPLVRINTGGEYTFSFWMYVNGWDYRSGLPKSVIQITDSDLTNFYLLNTILYPNESKLMIRIHTASSLGTDYTDIAQHDALVRGTGSLATDNTMSSPVCDIMDIDLQRWLNITIAVNGRIVDVYYDGKLNRSCVLPDLTEAGSPASVQTVQIGDKGGFTGQLTGIQFFSYALTPDRIYAIYQHGPTGAASLVASLFQKLGIKISSSGSTPMGSFM